MAAHQCWLPIQAMYLIRQDHAYLCVCACPRRAQPRQHRMLSTFCQAFATACSAADNFRHDAAAADCGMHRRVCTRQLCFKHHVTGKTTESHQAAQWHTVLSLSKMRSAFTVTRQLSVAMPMFAFKIEPTPPMKMVLSRDKVDLAPVNDTERLLEKVLPSSRNPGLRRRSVSKYFSSSCKATGD